MQIIYMESLPFYVYGRVFLGPKELHEYFTEHS